MPSKMSYADLPIIMVSRRYRRHSKTMAPPTFRRRRICRIGLLLLTCARVSSFNLESPLSISSYPIPSAFSSADQPNGQRIHLRILSRGYLPLFGANDEEGEGYPREPPSVPSSFSENVGQEFDGFLDEILARGDERRFSKMTEDVPAKAAVDQPATQDDMRKVMEQQQKQIDMLMSLVQKQTGNAAAGSEGESLPPKRSTTVSDARKAMSQVPSQTQYNPQDGELFVSSEEIESSTSPSSGPLGTPNIAPRSNVNVAPLKAMLFVDGTWLFYSIHRRSIIPAKYGKFWKNRYTFDWSELPRVICEEMQKQVISQGWDSSSEASGGHRPVEIVRACVFTSYKKNTQKNSDRVQMFEEMSEAGYDVHIMETVGDGEKCIDIQLAVEMLHYATVPNAYDVAILLSGDKDFLPALIRTRQKAKKVAIVSTRRGCNQALFDTPNIKDYDIVWIEDYLDRLIVPTKIAIRNKPPDVSPFTMAKIIRDLIKTYGDEKGQLSSRHIGRGLKELIVGDVTLLEEMKTCYRGIRFFAEKAAPNVFTYHERPWDPEATPSEFWFGLAENSEAALAEMGKNTNFTKVETKFLREYLTDEQSIGKPDNKAGPAPVAEPLQLPSELTVDYSTYKVAELKERCRERGLPVYGTKAVLLERVEADVKEEISRLEQEHKEKQRKVIPHRATARIDPGFQMKLARLDDIDPAVTDHISTLVKEYIHACGGKAGSRDLGRYLASNKAHQSKYISAIQEIKQTYGSLVNFIVANSDTFSKGRTVLTKEGKQYGFPVWERKEGDTFIGRSDQTQE